MNANKEIPQPEQNKFFVWKVDDLIAVLASGQEMMSRFQRLMVAVDAHRRSLGKGANDYLVCNKDEPYADTVWRTILEGDMEKAGIDPDDTWTCGICGVVKFYADEKPVDDAETGECCAEHYEGGEA